jgi:hypothetical protein
MRLCCRLFFGGVVLALEEGSVILEELVEPSAAQPLGRIKRVKRTAPIVRCKGDERDLLSGLICCLRYLRSTVRPLERIEHSAWRIAKIKSKG